MKNIILHGAPGSGKGTQSAFLIRDFGLVQISTGDILRAAVKEGTTLGRNAERYMKDGKLVPDEVIIGIMQERLKEPDAKNGCILDGFPRTIQQADELERMLKDLGTVVHSVVSLEVPDDVLLDRITGRWSCPRCGKVYHSTFSPPRESKICDDDNTALIQRADDTLETMSKRLTVYHETTALLTSYYEKLGILRLVDGTQSPEEVYQVIKKDFI